MTRHLLVDLLTPKRLSEPQLIKLGVQLARCLSAADVVALEGPLGAGKTTLVRAILQSIMGQGCDIPSPTFTLVQTYLPKGDYPQIWHFDLYRLDHANDVWELGWETALEDIAFVEWPQKAGRNLPPNALKICLDYDAENTRIVDFVGDVWRQERFSTLFGSD